MNERLDRASSITSRALAVVIFVVIGLIALLALGALLIIAAILWSQWHTQVVIPLQGTDLALVYQHKTYRTGNPWERLVLAEASSIDTPLDQRVSRIHKYNQVGGELWRTPDRSAYYLRLQAGLYWIDIANRKLRSASYPADVCPSDATAPKWSMEQVDPKTYPSRPADFIFVGAIRDDRFTPASRLPPPAQAEKRRNCAAEAAVWEGHASTTLDAIGLTVTLRVRWLPGETVFHEFSLSPGWSRAWPSNGRPPPRTEAMPPRIRFSLYRDGDRIYFVEDGESSSVSDLNLRVRSGSVLSKRERPACRVGDPPQPEGLPDNETRASRHFERLLWLGRFEARLASMPDGRWSGKLVFVSPADAAEDLSDPERFCDPTARRAAEGAAHRKSGFCAAKPMAPCIGTAPDDEPDCSQAP